MESIGIPEVRSSMQHTKRLYRLFIHIIVGIVITYICNKSFLVFHTIIEFFTVIVALTMTIISYNTYEINKDNQMLFLGIAYGFIASFDLIHILYYKGMGVFAQDSANLPTQLWIIARYMESISLLVVLAFPNRKFRLIKVVLNYSIASILLFISVFYLQIFPDCYLDNSGLTTFKIISEYIISGILILGIFFLVKNKHSFSKEFSKFILLSLAAKIISEIFFVFYINVYDISNIMGHVFKLISFDLFYIVLIESSIKKPHLALEKMNRMLFDKNNELEAIVDQLCLENRKRKSAEDEALRGKEMLNAILEVSSGGILVANNKGKIIHFNAQFTKLWGESNKVACDADIDDVIIFVKEQIVNKEELEQSIAKEWETFDEYIFYLKHKNGKFFEVFSLPLIDKEIIAGRIFSFKDITDRKKVEELMRNIEIKQKMLDKAKEYDDMKNDFFLQCHMSLKRH